MYLAFKPLTMYIPGTIIYFTPFYFPDGRSKNKYFLVLSAAKDSLLVACLPTSKDNIPRSRIKKHGCINDDIMRVNCYFFEAGRIISECGTFCFERDTYVYGEQIAFVDKHLMKSAYKKDGEDYRVLCKLSKSELQSVKDCLRNAGVVSNKFKRFL
jgi:hypothetical protein